MFSRKEIKARAKTAFNKNYWRCVAVTLIMSVITGGMVSGSGSSARGAGGTTVGEAAGALNNAGPEEEIVMFLVLLGVFAIAFLLASVLSVFVINPLNVGEAKFFRENDTAPADIAVITSGFRNGYLRNAGAMLLRNLLTGLGSIVIIPGIILRYSYRMVPYILADDPEISAADALRKSREMMKGSKWDTFVLELSFIGWDILTVLTLGILGIVYVGPWKKQTMAELYLKLCGKADETEAE